MDLRATGSLASATMLPVDVSQSVSRRPIQPDLRWRPNAESARPELDRRRPTGRRYVRSRPPLRLTRYKVTEQILPVREQLRIAEGRNPQPSAGLIDSQTVKRADTVGRESRGQNVAIGLTGLPDVPAKRTGATVRWKSHWLSSAAVVAHTSRSQLSSSHRPIATRLTA
jgi:hypothetical protein